MLLEVHDLTVRFRGPAGIRIPAVEGVSFELDEGRSLALVGESGSGKTVTSLALMRLLPPTAEVGGRISFSGHDVLRVADDDLRRLRGALMAMIFQEPMNALNPVMRVGDQVAEAVRAHLPVSKKEAMARAIEVFREVALPEPEKRVRDYPHQLSGGMRQRVMIAMSLVHKPALLIADEPTTALDVTVQRQILELIAELRRKHRLALLFISHDLAVVAQVAERVAVMYAGNIVEMGSTERILKDPVHPYTRGLLRSAPSLKTPRHQPLKTIEGTVPGAQSLPPGCRFEPRCELRVEACKAALPELIEVAPGHWARCPVAASSR